MKFLKFFDCRNLKKVKVSTKEEEAEIRALIAAQSGKQHAGNQFGLNITYIRASRTRRFRLKSLPAVSTSGPMIPEI